MHRCLTGFASVAIFLGICSSATAALTVSLSPSTAFIGDSGGTITFTGSIDGDPGDTLTSYDLFIDIVGINLDDAGPVSIANQVLLTGFDLPSTSLPLDDRDIGFGGVNLFTPAVAISDPVTLFSFDATFSAAPLGTTFVFNFDPQAAGSGISVNASALDLDTDVTFSGASVTVVPEPSAVLALGFVFSGAAVRARKRYAS